MNSPSSMNLWTFSGGIGPKDYAVAGCSLMALKLGIDNAIAWFAFGRLWPPTHYVFPEVSLGTLRGDPSLFLTLLTVSMPFLWVGFALTTRRLRSMGWPLILVFLFAVPLVNLVFFVGLSTLPPRSVEAPNRARSTPRTAKATSATNLAAACKALMLWGIVGVPLAVLGVHGVETYGFGLFVLMPITLGFVCVAVRDRQHNHGTQASVLTALIALGLACCAALLLGFEGMICIVMASPILVGATLIGVAVGRAFISDGRPRAPRTVVSLLILMPALVLAEAALLPAPAIRSVTSTVNINAAPTRVWRNVVEFPPLAPPTEPWFKAGIAYPTHATIKGRGPGAMRECVFSTGSFMEPIEVWDEPRRLQFAVTECPAPMTELSPFSIHPPHLHDNFVATKGQFVLEDNGKGGTHLVGTTWYRQSLWPQWYWGLWSDAIVHSIHNRVLNHVQQLSEE